MDNTDRVSELEREIKERMNELKELTLSDSDRAYASYLAAVDNCQDLWVKYIETLQKELKIGHLTIIFLYLDW
jgi:hypothetical protein